MDGVTDVTLSHEEMNELQRNEAWLREFLRDTAIPDVHALKTRVLVAVEEARLTDHFSTEPAMPDGLTRAAKGAIREQFATQAADIGPRGVVQADLPRRPEPGPTGRWRRWFIGGALAAAACITVALLPRLTIQDESGAAYTEALAVLDAFEARSDDDFAESVDELRRAIREVESSLAGVAARNARESGSPDNADDLYDVWAELLDENRPS